MFYIAEYIDMVTVAAVATNLFLGGWTALLADGLRLVWFLIKLRSSSSSTCGCAGRCRASATTS